MESMDIHLLKYQYTIYWQYSETKSVQEMAVERKEKDLPKFTSNVVILEWGLVNTKKSNLMMPDFLV